MGNGDNTRSVTTPETTNFTSRGSTEQRETDDRFRAIFDNHHVVMLIIDPETGKIEDGSPAACAFYGYSRDELKKKRIGEINTLTPDQVGERLQSAKSRQQKYFDFQHRLASGEIRDVEVCTGPIVMDGRTLLFSVINDVTDRKRAEAAIKESEARVRMRLDSILAPEGDIGALELADVIDAQTVQALMDDFFGLTNIGVGIIDLQGKVLVATGWQEICTKFHRAHPETCRYCVESDTELSGPLEQGAFKLYRCKNNMWDIATPIFVGGKHLGNLFLGQFLFEDEAPDYEVFRSQARRYGFDEQQYLAALDKVPRWSRQTVDTAMAFYTKLAGMLSTLSYSNIKLARSLAEQERLLNSLRESEQRYRAVVDNIEVGISVLNPDMQIVEVNKAFKRYYPHVQPGCGQICYEQYNDPPRSGPCSYCPCVLTLRDGKVHEEITETPAGSETRCYHLISSPIKDPQGQVQYVIELVEDITKRKQAEEQIRRAERRYRRLFEHAPLMYVITRNEQGVPFISDCNESFLKSLGYLRDDVVGQPLANFYSPTSTADLLEGGGYARALAGEFLIGERQLLRRDGSVIPTLLYTAPEVDTSGQVIGTCAMFVDITEQKKAEEALLRSEAQLSDALTMAHLGHWEYDAIKDLFTFNDHFYRIFRTTVEQVGGYTMSSADYARRFVHPDDAALVADEIRNTLRTTDPNFQRQLEHRMVYADGEIGHMTVRYFVVKDEFGRTVGTYGVNQDITNRKKAEEALRSEREQLLSIFESINEVILVIDPTTYEILYANKFTEDLYGKKLKGEICYEALDGFDRPCGHCAIDNVMELQGKPYQREYHNPVLNRDFLATDRMIRWSDGRDVKFQIAVDITERKLAEQEKENLRSQLLQAQKMEAVGTLAGGIAHDFNNLLQVASGYSELLLQQKNKDDAEYADLLRIFQAAKNGAELVHSLLTFSRKVEPRLTVLNLNTQIIHVDKLLRRTIPKMIAIRLDLSSDLADINADPTQMEQILMNLAINASDAMPDGGSLTISTRTETIDEAYCKLHAGATPGEHAVLAVTDTGHGMDKTTVEHIFEPFYTTKEIGRGTGLGLAMVYGIVTQHGGHIVCNSEMGRGTTFSIYLPAVPAAAEPAVESSGEMPAFGTETILLVDDEDLIRELGSRILERSGYTVLTAANGEEALSVYLRQKEHIALIILDLIMPTMGGKDCLKELLRINPQAKILIASGYSADASTREILALGAKDFVAKPFKFKGLLQKVRKALDRN